jgi:hypothetical protein
MRRPTEVIVPAPTKAILSGTCKSSACGPRLVGNAIKDGKVSQASRKGASPSRRGRLCVASSSPPAPPLPPPIRLAELGVEKWPDDPNRWNTLGAVYYRADRLEDVRKQFEASLKDRSSPSLVRALVDTIFMAMIQMRQGKIAEAQRDLALARKVLNVQTALPWNNKLEIQLLLRETETLVKPASP